MMRVEAILYLFDMRDTLDNELIYTKVPFSNWIISKILHFLKIFKPFPFIRNVLSADLIKLGKLPSCDSLVFSTLLLGVFYGFSNNATLLLFI